MAAGIAALVFVFFAVIIVLRGLHIVQEYERCVVFRLGRFSRIGGPGLFWVIPLVEWTTKIDLRTRTVDIEQQGRIWRPVEPDGS